MIKANELRIKNLVTRKDGFIYTVTGVTLSDVFIERKENGKLIQIISREDEIEPIPLTEEWLNKFGFNLSGWTKYSIECVGISGLKSQTYNIVVKQNSTYFIVNGSEYSFVQKVGIINNFISGETKHVHQLQNLYFALTGEELTMK